MRSNNSRVLLIAMSVVLIIGGGLRLGFQSAFALALIGALGFGLLLTILFRIDYVRRIRRDREAGVVSALARSEKSVGGELSVSDEGCKWRPSKKHANGEINIPWSDVKIIQIQKLQSLIHVSKLEFISKNGESVSFFVTSPARLLAAIVKKHPELINKK